MSEAAVEIPVPRHPAAWNRKALIAASRRLAARFGEHPAVVLDPFAGVGRVHELRRFGWQTVGGELEPAWAAAHPDTIVADALAFPADDGAFDAVVTSPTWGSRMADHHDAKERCTPCGGTGTVTVQCVDLLDRVDLGDAEAVCEKCGGSGVRDHVRNTYRHALGSPLTDGSSAAMNWGNDYRRFHRDWVVEARRLVKPGGLVIVNMSNHIRKGVEIDVIGWWLVALHAEGLLIRAVDSVPAGKLRHGANHELRVDGEVNIVYQIPA